MLLYISSMVKSMVLDMMVMTTMLGYIKELFSQRSEITVMKMIAIDQISIMLKLGSIFLRMHMKLTVKEEIAIKTNLGEAEEGIAQEKIDMKANLRLAKEKKKVTIDMKTSLGLEEDRKKVIIGMRTNHGLEKGITRVMIINREEKISLGKEKDRKGVKLAIKTKANHHFKELLLLRLLNIESKNLKEDQDTNNLQLM